MADKKCGKLTKWGCLVFHRKRLEPRVLPWQHSFCFFCDTHFWCQVWRTLLQYFQRYSLFSVLLFKLNYLWCHHFPHLHNTKLWICLKRKKIFQKRKRHSFLLWKAFQISSNYFLLHRHFKLLRHSQILQNAIDSSGTVVTQVPDPLPGPLLVCIFPLTCRIWMDRNLDKTILAVCLFHVCIVF